VGGGGGGVGVVFCFLGVDGKMWLGHGFAAKRFGVDWQGHGERGLDIANALAAVEAGADGSVHGVAFGRLGENASAILRGAVAGESPPDGTD